jgi:hypothetical protein
MKREAMKKTYSKSNSGSVLVGALIFVLMIAVFLYSYLWLVSSSNQSVARAQRWNSALAVAEAGIEEGLANLNSTVTVSTSSNAISFTPNPLRNSLVIGLNGSYIGNYIVSNYVDTTSMTNLVLISTGIVSAPITGDVITRTVRVVAHREGLVTKGIVALYGTDLSGNGGDPIFNSYDSRFAAYNPNSYFTNGTISVLSGVLDLANHTVAGNVNLGDSASINPTSHGNITGTTNYGWNMQYPEVTTLPQTDANGNPLPSMWPDAPLTKSPKMHVFTNSGYYTIRDTYSISVPAGVTVTLDVKVSTYDMTASSISIDGGTTNAGTLIVYQESGTAAFGKTSMGAVNNNPINFQYFGMPGVTEVDLSGGGTVFQGVFYAPDSLMTMNGGGSDVNFMGGFVVNSLTDKGHYLIHYDKSLEGYYYSYFVPSSWQELPPPTQ